MLHYQQVSHQELHTFISVSKSKPLPKTVLQETFELKVCGLFRVTRTLLSLSFFHNFQHSKLNSIHVSSIVVVKATVTISVARYHAVRHEKYIFFYNIG